MRKRGMSVRDIEHTLEIPRSTLSGWFKRIELHQRYKDRLQLRWRNALVNARKKAVLWHNKKKNERIAYAESEGEKTIHRLKTASPDTLELALAMLYLGEGAKAGHTGMGNSNPTTLRFFVKGIQKLYNIAPEQFKCYLHLRADQDPQTLKRFWARALGIPIGNFGKSLIDKRTKGTTTYPYYKGVCSVTSQRIAIQRKLMYIANQFCVKIAE